MPVADKLNKKKPILASRSMEEFKQWRAIVTVAAGGTIFLSTLASWIFGGAILGLVTLVVLSVLFITDSFVYADAGRFEKIVPMIFGVFVDKLEGPGYFYIPLKTFSFLLSYKKINGQEIDFGFAVEEYLPVTESKILLHNDLYVVIDPDNPIKFIEIGGFLGAFKRLMEQMGQWERNWISSPTEGPQTVDDARGMKNEAILKILRMFLEDDLRRLAPDIPDEIILGFITHRRPSTKEQELMTAKLEQKDSATKENILKAGRELLNLIQRARTGEMSIALHGLGLIVTRFGVDSIEPAGETISHMDEVNKATFEATKRKIVARGYAEAAKILAEAPGFKGDSMQTMLIAEGVVKKEVKETEVGLADPILETAKVLFQPIITAVASRIAGGKE